LSNEPPGRELRQDFVGEATFAQKRRPPSRSVRDEPCPFRGQGSQFRRALHTVVSAAQRVARCRHRYQVKRTRAYQLRASPTRIARQTGRPSPAADLDHRSAHRCLHHGIHARERTELVRPL